MMVFEQFTEAHCPSLKNSHATTLQARELLREVYAAEEQDRPVDDELLCKIAAYIETKEAHAQKNINAVESVEKFVGQLKRAFREHKIALRNALKQVLIRQTAHEAMRRAFNDALEAAVDVADRALRLADRREQPMHQRMMRIVPRCPRRWYH